MKRWLAALLTLCVLLLAGCAKQPPPDDAPEKPPAADVPAPIPVLPPAAAPEAAPPEESAVTVYTFDGLELPIPAQYVDLLLIDTDLEPWNAHRTPLVSLSEQGADALWLCTVSRLDRIGFEDWASSDFADSTLFARDGEERYYLISRPDAAPDDASDQWKALFAWTDTLTGAIVAQNDLTAYDASDLFDADYTYGGKHVELGCRFPGKPMDLVLLSLSQPARQGEGGLWCVERVHDVYSDYGLSDTHLVFPAALGADEAAADYYARLQTECDTGQHPELLTPRGAALDYARRAAWRFGEDVSATDFEVIEALG